GDCSKPDSEREWSEDKDPNSEEEEEAAHEGQQQQAVQVVDTTIDEPLGLGYGAARCRALESTENKTLVHLGWDVLTPKERRCVRALRVERPCYYFREVEETEGSRQARDDALRKWEAQIDQLRREEHEVSEYMMVHTHKNDVHQKETSQIERISSLPEKPNPGSLTIPCSVDIFSINVIADLGASVNIMSKSMLDELSLADPKHANIIVKMTDKIREVSLVIKEDRILIEEQEDSDECGENKERAIIRAMVNKLPEEWFSEVSRDKDDLEGIIDYLKPILYDGFIDYNDEAYKQRRNKLLGMPYIEPPPVKKEEAEITKYNLRAGEVFKKNKILTIKEFPRIAANIVDIRAEIIEDKNSSSEDLSNTKRRHWCKPIYQWKEDICTKWASCNPHFDECDGGNNPRENKEY
ncbi:hypothetical protein Tco_0071626, partial [Tanacetum coccineum]